MFMSCPLSSCRVLVYCVVTTVFVPCLRAVFRVVAPPRIVCRVRRVCVVSRDVSFWHACLVVSLCPILVSSCRVIVFVSSCNV